MRYLHPHYLNLLGITISRFVSTVICRIKALWWGVKLGKRSQFRGCTIFRTLPNSQIVIGNHACFNSSHSSNLIGVYTPCIIATLCRNAEIKIGNDCGFSGTVVAAAVDVVADTHMVRERNLSRLVDITGEAGLPAALRADGLTARPVFL